MLFNKVYSLNMFNVIVLSSNPFNLTYVYMQFNVNGIKCLTCIPALYKLA